MTVGVYQIKNTDNGKIYIGSSINIERRWREHKYRLASGEHKNIHLLRSWNKHGAKAFEFSLIYEVDTPEELEEHEQWCMDIMFPEYNNTPNAGHRVFLGVKRPDGYRCGEKHPFFGRSHTSKSIQLMSDNRTGKTCGEKNPNSVFTEEEVMLARWLFDTGEYSQTWLAEYFGVTIAALHLVVRRKAWKHVKEILQ